MTKTLDQIISQHGFSYNKKAIKQLIIEWLTIQKQVAKDTKCGYNAEYTILALIGMVEK